MDVAVKSARLTGVINAIPSKSYAHRIAICNFLAGKDPAVDCGGFTSKDITATEECLRGLASGKTILDCGESGSTLRFILPLLSVLGGEYELVGHGKLMSRPNDELFKVLTEHDITIKQDKTISLSGKLTPGEFSIRGDISSQYVSGLLMALPTLKGDSEIKLLTPLASAPYVEITLEVLRAFGIKIKKTADGFFVKGGQVYSGDVTPEGDWSNGAFFLVAGAVSGDITVKGLNLKSAQGDKAILDVLKRAGATIEILNDGINVKKSRLNGFIMDAENCPDLVPICAVLSAFSKGASIIKNIQRLKIKESDRIESTIAMLKGFGITAECDGKDLTIYGGAPRHGNVDSFNDHRIAMSVAVLASGAEGENHSVITDAYAVEKSYPNFYKDYNLLGGKASDI